MYLEFVKEERNERSVRQEDNIKTTNRKHEKKMTTELGKGKQKEKSTILGKAIRSLINS